MPYEGVRRANFWVLRKQSLNDLPMQAITRLLSKKQGYWPCGELSNKLGSLCNRLLRPREPFVIERSVPPVFVHFEQRFVDPLTQRATIGDGNTVLLRLEDWTNDQ